MTAEQAKKFNIFFGSVLAISGLLGWGTAAYYATVPKEPKPVVTVMTPSVDAPSCVASLQQMGYVAVLQGRNVSAHEGFSPDMSPRERMEKASAAVLLCQGRLRDFCIGNRCDQPGVSFTVELPEPRGTAPAPAAGSAPSPVATTPASPPR